jgi:hypothetical protein
MEPGKAVTLEIYLPFRHVEALLAAGERVVADPADLLRN